MERGVTTLVDLTPGEWRDVPFVAEVARQSGLQIIVATGLYWDPPRYFGGRDADHMADVFVRDILEGITDTGIRAAIIKCATDEAGVTTA
jgi:phosphotriesterase-related protein